jgi:hypothetical protein
MRIRTHMRTRTRMHIRMRMRMRAGAAGAHWAKPIVGIEPMTIRLRSACSARRGHDEAQHTHRGARTHDHKVKGLALCRLS